MNEKSIEAQVSEAFDKIGAVTHYELLGVSTDADVNTIRSAFRDKAKIFHADKHRNSVDADTLDKMQSVFAALSEAQTTLMDATKRADYDASLSLEGSGVPTDISRIFKAEQLHRIGKRLMDRGDLLKAKEHFEEALEHDSSEPAYHAWLAWTRYSIFRQIQNEKKSKAVEAQVEEIAKELRMLVKENPKCEPGHLFLAHIARNQGDVEAARRGYERVLQLSPRHLEAESNVRLLRMREKKSGFFSKLFKR